MSDLYQGREQTKAKHFILKRYLQELAFKVLNGWNLTYVDGFSGPWEERDENFADTSFKIAIDVLMDAQKVLRERGIHRRIRCFFSENNPRAFARLKPAVDAYHNPTDLFEIQTYCGRFEDAIPTIQQFIVGSFPLVFIDPTGWTGYPLDRIRPLFAFSRCEVLVNFMYDYVNRFVASDDAATVASFDAILGGPGWRNRIDPALPMGAAVEGMFRAALRQAGNFDFVVSTKIDKSTQDRPHFFIAYGTKSEEGLKAFRQVEYDALRRHEKDRLAAKEREQEAKTGQSCLFPVSLTQPQGSTVDELVRDQIGLAKPRLLDLLAGSSLSFSRLVPQLLQPFMIRETNVKDLCVALAREGLIENTWAPANRKPNDVHLIRLATHAQASAAKASAPIQRLGGPYA